MNLLNALQPLLNARTVKVALEVSAHPSQEGQMVVVARPVMGPVAKNASEELKQLCAALATPVKVVGSPDDIESALRERIEQQREHRDDWAMRAASLEAAIAEGQAKDAKSKSASKATSNTQTASSKKAETAAPSTTTASKPESKTGESQATNESAEANPQDEIGFSL